MAKKKSTAKKKPIAKKKTAKKKASAKKKAARSKPDPLLVTDSKLAELCGYKSPRYIQKMAADGSIPKAGKNQYHVIECMSAIIRNRPAAALKNNLLRTQEFESRERAMLNQTKRRQMQGELIYSDEVTAGTAQLVVGLVKIHDEMERNIRRRLPNVPDEVMVEVMKASNWARNAGKKLCETGSFELTDDAGD